MDKILKTWKKLSDAQLKELACKMYKKYFHHDLRSNVCFISDNPKSCGGFVPASILINPNNYKDFDNKEAMTVIKHELVHYYLFRKFDSHKKSGHNKYFYRIASKIGAGGRLAPLSLNVNEKDQEKYDSIAKLSKSRDSKGLQKLADKLCIKYFHKSLHCAVQFGSESIRNLGLYFAPSISINPEFIDNKGDSKKLALDSVKHELIHYYLFEKYNDITKCGHTKEFDKLADKLGINHDYKPWLKNNYGYHRYHKCFSKVARVDNSAKKDPNADVYFYYSCGIGLYSKPYLMYTGSRIHDKNNHLRKVYYVEYCKYKDYDKCKHYLSETLKKDKHNHAHIQDIYYDLINCML